jgi:3,4-dihydroxy 2-butanone 4-phosphate synthase/GTP cyclohydrolase II
MVIVVDDPARENEGDLVCAASKATPAAINFMAMYGRGLICLPIVGKRLDDLRITPMVENNEELRDAAFTVSVDARHRVTTGVSAVDRARTVQTILNPRTKPPARGMYSLCATGKGAFWCALATQKRRWIWPCWQVFIRPA